MKKKKQTQKKKKKKKKKTSVMMCIGAVLLLSACGKNGLNSLGANADQTGNSVNTVDNTVANTQTPTAVDNSDAKALADIAKMTQKQCQDAFNQLTSFYQATQGMTEQQVKDYFNQILQQAKQAGQPAPPPPPVKDGSVYLALQKCAVGTSATSTTTTTTTSSGTIATSTNSSGSTSTTTTPAAVNGVCGSANGVAVAKAPSTNLCQSGTASGVALSGASWAWSCAASSGGTSSTCAAAKKSVVYATGSIMGMGVILNYTSTGFYYQGAKCDVAFGQGYGLNCSDSGAGHNVLNCPAGSEQRFFFQTVYNNTQFSVALYCVQTAAVTATSYASGSVLAQYKIIQGGLDCKPTSGIEGNPCRADAGGRHYGVCPSGSTEVAVANGPVIANIATGEVVPGSNETLFSCIVP